MRTMLVLFVMFIVTPLFSQMTVKPSDQNLVYDPVKHELNMVVTINMFNEDEKIMGSVDVVYNYGLKRKIRQSDLILKGITVYHNNAKGKPVAKQNESVVDGQPVSPNRWYGVYEFQLNKVQVDSLASRYWGEWDRQPW